MKKILILSLLITTLFTACRSPEKLYSLAVKRGMTVDKVEDTLKISYIDSIVTNYKDSVVICYDIKYRDSVIIKSVVNFPKSNTAVRQEEKTKRKEIDSKEDVKKAELDASVDIKELESETKQDSIKQAGKTNRKTVKVHNKSSWWKFWLGFVTGLAFCFLLLTLATKLKNLNQ
jgi:hypothetical protein